jgi:uncharacterized membrane protein
VKLKTSNSNWILIFVAILTAVGGFLRFYNISYNSIWGDELYTLMFAETSLINIWSSFATDCHPPLFYWFEHIILQFGTSELHLRFIPALAGTLTIPLVFIVFRQIVSDISSLIITTFVALSKFHIYYSQDARMYTLWLFVFMISLYYYFKATHKPHDAISWAMFGITSGICMWVHFYAGLFFVLLLSHACFIFRKNIYDISKKLQICLISFFVVIITLIPAMIQIFTDRTSIPPWFGYTGVWVVHGVIYEFLGNYSMLIYLLSATFVLGCLIMWFNNRKQLAFVAFILIFSFVASIYYSYKMPMVGRYLIPILPIFYIPIAATFEKFYVIFEKIHKNLGILIFIIIIIINAPLLGLYHTTHSKEDLRGLSEYVSEISNDGDYLVLLTDGMVFRYYYNNTTDKTILYPSCTLDDLIKLNYTRGSTPMIIMPPYNKTALQPEMDWIYTNHKKIYTFGNEIYIYKL